MGTEVNSRGPGPRWLWALLALCVLSGVVASISGWGLLRGFDAQIHDRLTRLASQPSAPPEVVIIDIDESSLAQMGPWPWSRTVFAELVSQLRAKGARLQVWDLHFAEPAAGDDALSNAIASSERAGGAPDVVIGQVLVVDPHVHSPPKLGKLRSSSAGPPVCAELPAGITGHLGVAESLEGGLTGHLTATPDVDGRLRGLPAVACDGFNRYAQLILVAAEVLEPSTSWDVSPGSTILGPDRWLTKGRLRFALDGQGFIPIPYRNVHHAWTAVPVIKLLEGGANVPDLTGKTVLIGATALGLADSVSTPFHANAPGVSVHAELLAAALDHERWVVVPKVPSLAAVGVFMVGVLGLWPALLLWHRPSIWVPLGIMLSTSPMVIAWMARQYGYQVPVSAPVAVLLLTVVSLVAFQVETERRRARTLAFHLKSFLPSELATEIARQTPSGDSLGHPGLGVVMAVKISGLERWSSAVDSLQALALVHGVSTIAERQAARNGGRLEQLQGEILLFTWRMPLVDGVPRGELVPVLVRTCVESALATARSLTVELSDLVERHETERHPLGVRISLEHGPYLQAVAGSSKTRRPLLLGRAVDTALNLLPFCDELASPVLLGQQAAASEPRVAMSPMGSFLLTDNATPLTVYRVEP